MESPEVVTESKVETCECCPNEVKLGDIKIFNKMKMCNSCYQQELSLTVKNYESSEHMSAANQESRVMESRKLDSNIQIRADIFNAQTVSIIELKALIDADDSVPEDKKNFRLAEELTHRHNHFKKVIFDLNEEMVNKSNAQRAIQTYLNDMQNKLRTDERESLRLKDVTYKPAAIKLPTKESKPKIVKKYDKVGIRDAAITLNTYLVANGYLPFPESAIQMMCVRRNLNPIDAIEIIREDYPSKG